MELSHGDIIIAIDRESKAGLLRKASGPAGTVSLVDIYGTLLGSRLFVPSVYDNLNPQHLSLHMMRQNIDKGQHPMPIFTAIQHSKPLCTYFRVYVHIG